MKNRIARSTVLVAAISLACVSCHAAEKTAREDLGRTVKLKILVDKVMQPQADWVTEEWMVRETAEAGFNVFSPRRGHEDLSAVRDVSRWCRKYGIYHMPWMRGTLSAPEGPEAEGRRMVWASGDEQPLWSPNSDEFWEWTNRYILEYAKISAENPHLMGVFLDYENYAPGGGQGNCYGLSYDDLIMDMFAQEKAVALPVLHLGERKSWLEEQGLHEDFAQFQINHWRERCRTLREAVDELDPTFQFCVYPAPGTLFMTEAIYPEWATEDAPLILADPCTYGRPARYLPQEKALDGNRRSLQSRMELPRDARIPFMYAGGIDPVVTGADPEFCGKNAVMISELTDGYWIFYEGPKYTEDHPEYFRWFTWANKAISEGRLAAWHGPRETADEWTFPMLKPSADKPGLVVPEGSGREVEFPPVRLRGGNVLLVAGKAGERFNLVLAHQQVGDYTGDIEWDIKALEWDSLASGSIPRGERGTVTFTPKADGVYPIVVSAGRCAYWVVSSDAPVALFAGNGLSLIYGAERLYFKVPEGVEEFTLAAKGSGGETIRLTVYDPDGNQVATDQTTPKVSKIELTVPVGDRSGQVWSLATGQADEGALEDNSLWLDPKLPPALSLTPEHVFGFGEATD